VDITSKSRLTSAAADPPPLALRRAAEQRYYPLFWARKALDSLLAEAKAASACQAQPNEEEGRLAVILRWRHAGKRRWYAVWVAQDLFGALVLVRAWGSLDSRRGGRKQEVISCPQALEARLRVLARQRLRRGYVPVKVWSFEQFCMDSHPNEDHHFPSLVFGQAVNQ
jgi:predicted DNA-binding WGR domain protein